MVRLCFVCHANICRSPTAEGVMIRLLREAGLTEQVLVDSAGVGAVDGYEPDRRSAREAERRGIELRSRSRRFDPADLDEFDYVLAADTGNRDGLRQLTRDPARLARIHLLRDFDTAAPENSSIPDPYAGGPNGFRDVFDVCEAACRGLLEHLRREHDLV
jgi:protein-tyrosine phosphatase